MPDKPWENEPKLWRKFCAAQGCRRLTNTSYDDAWLRAGYTQTDLKFHGNYEWFRKGWLAK